MKLKIKAKLLLGFIGVALLALVVGILGITSMKTIDEADTVLYEKGVVPMEYVYDMGTYFQRIRVNLRDVIIADDAKEIKKYDSRIHELEALVKESDSKYQALLWSDEGKQLFAKYATARDAYFNTIDDLTQLAEANSDSLAFEVLHGDMFQKNKDMQDAIDEIVHSKIAQSKLIADNNTKLANSSTNIILIVLSIVMILAIALGFVIAGNIQSIIKSVIGQTKDLVKAAVAGKLATRANPEDVNEEFREILVGFNQTLDAVINPLNVAAE